jgi:transcriptional regulator with XRE-family HTH domain
MLVVETIARIRRERLIKGKTIKEIARDLKVSRNTVRRVLRSGETRFEYEREVQPRPKLGRWTDDLDGLLADNVTKPAREQLTLIRVFEELCGRGYEGGYDAVRRYARRWAKEHGHSTATAFVPLSFAPGEAYQFDWSHEIVLLSGATVTVKVAHMRLCHSSATLIDLMRWNGTFTLVNSGQPIIQPINRRRLVAGVFCCERASMRRAISNLNVGAVHPTERDPPGHDFALTMRKGQRGGRMSDVLLRPSP